jgi:antibiotic biosynthesis monooxygenase (ABM) superfamily enzyme
MTSSSPEPATIPAEIPTPAPMPSIHMRAFLTWLAIFPLVTIGMTLLAPITEHWPIVLRALVLTAVVVPTAVYLAMPQLLRAHGAVSRRRAQVRR